MSWAYCFLLHSLLWAAPNVEVAPAVVPASAPAGMHLVSKAMAMVGDEVLTSRMVQLDWAIEHWLLYRQNSRKTDPSLQWESLSDGKSELEKQLSGLILDVMVSAEAESLAMSPVSPSLLQDQRKEFELAYRNIPDWQRMHFQEQEIIRTLERHERAAEFLKLKTGSLGLAVTDAEALKYYNANKLKFGGLPFEQFREPIKDTLSKQQVEIRLKDWLGVLRRKYKVRILNSEPGA